jgi:hypothetical protein
MEADAVAFVVKPFMRESLARNLEKLLSHRFLSGLPRAWRRPIDRPPGDAGQRPERAR